MTKPAVPEITEERLFARLGRAEVALDQAREYIALLEQRLQELQPDPPAPKKR